MPKTLDIDTLKKSMMRSVASSEPLTETQSQALEQAVDEELTKFIVPDTPVYRAAVYSLALAVIIAVCSAVLLAYKEAPVPDVISVVAGAAIGALAGMLSSK